MEQVTGETLTERKIFQPYHIGIATFFGTPLAGTIILALNYKKFQQPAKAKWSLFWGILITAIIFTLALNLPEEFPGSVINIPVLIVMVLVSNHLQKEMINRCLAEGSQVESGWKAAGIGILCCIFLILLAVPFFI